jgi:hypothetical protein
VREEKAWSPRRAREDASPNEPRQRRAASGAPGMTSKQEVKVQTRGPDGGKPDTEETRALANTALNSREGVQWKS